MFGLSKPRLAPTTLFAACLLLLMILPARMAEAQEFFWEQSARFVSGTARFPRAVSNGRMIAVVWQETVGAARGGGDTYLSIRVSRDGIAWHENVRFAGPFSFVKWEAPIFSLTLDPQDRILVAIASGENAARILASQDQGRSFQVISEVQAFSTITDPTIFAMAGGGYLLFATYITQDFLAIFYAVSEDGMIWSDFQRFATEGDLLINFLPHHVSLEGREYVVFQSAIGGEVSNYQLFLKTSDDGGATWGPSIPIRFEADVGGETISESTLTHQRPFIARLGDGLALTWEAQRRGRAPQIYYGELDVRGQFVTGPEQVSEGANTCQLPQIVVVEDDVYLVWFDDRRGEDRIIFAERGAYRWEQGDFSSAILGGSKFAFPVALGAQLYIFWENSSAGQSRLYYRAPDLVVRAPDLRAINFSPARESRQETVRIRWAVPSDTSGIAGFSFVWGTDPNEPLARELLVLSDVTSVSLKAQEDGAWFFRLAAQDYAGNWSPVAVLPFVRDTSPPAQVTINMPETDDDGYLLNNSFAISWESAEVRIAGYSYALRYLGVQTRAVSLYEGITAALPPRIITRGSQTSYRNLDNGHYAFSVSAIDVAGNFGEPTTVNLSLNQYVPITYITSIDRTQDELGNVEVGIRGRGFSEGGLVERVLLDRDGAAPFDYQFELAGGAYAVKSDRLIGELLLSDLEAGSYHIGLVHPLRGTYMSRGPLLGIEAYGTVKFGRFYFVRDVSWKSLKQSLYFFTMNEITVWLTVLFLMLLFLALLRKLVSVVRESQLLRSEIGLLVHGAESRERKERRMQELKRRGIGLRVKYALLMMILVFLIVIIVSLPLSFYMIETQRGDLADSLYRRAEVLLGSLSAGAEENLAVRNRLELALLPAQISGMEEEFVYTTITGAGETDANNFEYVWSSNDPEIVNKTEGETYRQGESVLQDAVSERVADLAEQINREAREAVSELAVELDGLRDEARKLALKTDVDSRQRYEQISDAILQKSQAINDGLSTIGARIESFPQFAPDDLRDEYIFYRPVVYRLPGEDVYYRGLVRLGVSTRQILREIEASRDTLILRTGLIALVAVGLGVVAAVLLASITIIPIKKLAVGVAVIRDTEDKERLRDHHIQIRSKDEIGVLAETVNQMTQALVRAAAANKELTVGKEVQKMFIPLEKDSSGEKRNTGAEATDYIELFGYYEGAKGVSGDYFDYMKLDDKHYAIIKCDVAGKGVPAALIMVEVATIFTTFFKSWKKSDVGQSTEQVVYTINDMLEERGFKGRFAALTVCILNAESGVAYFTNAGDNILHFFDSRRERMLQKKLPEAPAAGVFPSTLVEMQSGFKHLRFKLTAGDTLFLFTDGLDEAERKFRDAEMRVIECDAEVAEGEMHAGTHKKGEEREEMGLERIYDIVNAVYQKGSYRLVRHHTSLPEDLSFDFSGCEGSVREAVLAMIAVEKVFRMYQDPNAGRDDRVTVDAKVDAFLQNHFEQYRLYFGNKLEADGESETVQVTHLKEDEQYDDLTVLAIRKR